MSDLEKIALKTYSLALIAEESILRELLFFLELKKRPKEVLFNSKKKSNCEKILKRKAGIASKNNSKIYKLENELNNH